MYGENQSRPNLISPLLPLLVHIIMFPPVFKFTVKRIKRYLMDDCCTKGNSITVPPRGFMNDTIFIQWIEHFNDIIISYIKMPLMLILYG